MVNTIPTLPKYVTLDFSIAFICFDLLTITWSKMVFFCRQLQAFIAMLQSNPALMSALGRNFATITRDLEKLKKLEELEVMIY